MDGISSSSSHWLSESWSLLLIPGPALALGSLVRTCLREAMDDNSSSPSHRPSKSLSLLSLSLIPHPALALESLARTYLREAMDGVSSSPSHRPSESWSLLSLSFCFTVRENFMAFCAATLRSSWMRPQRDYHHHPTLPGSLSHRFEPPLLVWVETDCCESPLT